MEVSGSASSAQRDAAVNEYRRKLLEHRERTARVRALRTGLMQVKKEFDKSEDDLKALQSVGQIIGEVLRQLDEDRLIVKASSGPRSGVDIETEILRIHIRRVCKRDECSFSSTLL